MTARKSHSEEQEEDDLADALADARLRLDALDEQLFAVLDERFTLVRELTATKPAIYDPVREAAIHDRVQSLDFGSLRPAFRRQLLNLLLRESKLLQAGRSGASEPVRVAVGSLNPVKRDAVTTAFLAYVPDVDVVARSVPSGVPAQPFGNEMLTGAINRAEALRDELGAGADTTGYFVGLEGGVIDRGSRWYALAACAVLASNGRVGTAFSPQFELPPAVIRGLRDGDELGMVMDRVTGKRNTKQKGGAVGYFSAGVIDRAALYVPAVVLALSALRWKDGALTATQD